MTLDPALRLLALLLLLLAAAGCLPLRSNSIAQSAPPRSESVALDHIAPAGFPAEIARLEKIINTATAPREKAAAQHRLALLHLLPANPNRDLDRGAAALQIYVEQLPAGSEKEEKQLYLQMLRERILLEKQAKEQEGKSRRDATGLKLEKQQLSQQVQDLTAANAKLKADIEKLKMIDLSVEKKRKSFR